MDIPMRIVRLAHSDNRRSGGPSYGLLYIIYIYIYFA